MALQPELPLHVDSTMMTCARSCLQKFRKEFILGLRPSGLSIDLHAGGCFALALEHVYKAVWEMNKSLPDALDYAHAAFALAWGNFEIPEWKTTGKTFDNTWDAVLEYFKRWDPRSDYIPPYINADGKPTIEYTFAIPLGPVWGDNEDEHPDDEMSNAFEAGCFPLHPSGQPFIYTGRFDMLGQYQGRPIVRDEKTSGKTAGSNWAEQWDFRAQFIGYTWACQQAGLPVDSVCVRGISILKTKRDTAEAIKTYSDLTRERWLEQLRRDLWRIRRAWDSSYFDYNMGDACTAYGNCVFLTSCVAPPAQEEAWLSEFSVRRWNPLLKNPVEGETP